MTDTLEFLLFNFCSYSRVDGCGGTNANKNQADEIPENCY